MSDAIKLAIERIEKYISERAKMRGLDRELIHGLHSDDPREAELLVSDLSEMVAALRALPSPPPECKSEAEKIAYAFGWWKALESVEIGKEKV